MLIVDRFENNIAVIESDDGMIQVKKSEIGEDVNEGDVVFLRDGIYIKDSAATEERKKNMTLLFKSRLRKKRTE